MTDFLEKYHHKKIASNIFIVFGALIMAFGINFFLIDDTNFGKNLKTSVLDIQNTEEKSDIFLQAQDGKIFLRNSKFIKNITNFSVSISYNPENIEITNITSPLGEISILGEKSDGVINIILSTPQTDVQINEQILEIQTQKKVEESTGMNLVNGNFTDTTGDKFELTTSGIVF